MIFLNAARIVLQLTIILLVFDDGLPLNTKIIVNELKEQLKKESFNLELDADYSPFVKSVKYYLWTLSKDMKPLNFEYNREDVIKDLWLKNKPLKVIIHGWHNSHESKIFAIAKAYVEQLEHYNVITVDWSAISLGDYSTAAGSCKKLGVVIGHVLIHLTRLELAPPDMIHLIGHSLGAHIAGSAGHTYEQGTNTKISRITGLDPPSPYFSDSWIFWTKYDRLDKENAEFVDVIKTTTTIGLTVKIGHAEFHPNGGTNQPGCNGSWNPFKNWMCSHNKSHKYYSESIYSSDSFESLKCDSFKSFKEGTCKDQQKNYMGHYADASEYGDFYLVTNEKKPYSVPLPTW